MLHVLWSGISLFITFYYFSIVNGCLVQQKVGGKINNVIIDYSFRKNMLIDYFIETNMIVN